MNTLNSGSGQPVPKSTQTPTQTPTPTYTQDEVVYVYKAPRQQIKKRLPMSEAINRLRQDYNGNHVCNGVIYNYDTLEAYSVTPVRVHEDFINITIGAEDETEIL